MVCASPSSPAAETPRQFSGIYPHLAVSNDLGECGTGGVVPWAGKLWVITYGPHQPNGSTDKLYEIDPALGVTVRPESVGGTPANRLIHRESEQLFIGPYVIGKDGAVRVIPPKVMPGRLTGMARHLTDPAGKVYFATMEEGFYEVDVKSLAVTELFKTERDIFLAQGTFYELPSEMTGGFAKIRPVATHGRRITDFCSWRGMLILSGLAADGTAENPHVIRSDDGKAAVWLGTIDDLWQFGKPTGHGGPWKDSPVQAGQPSDAYLFTGYDRRTLTLSHDSTEPVAMRVEVDISGEGDWRPYRTFDVPAGHEEKHVFAEAFAAYWLRVVAARGCHATAWLTYE